MEEFFGQLPRTAGSAAKIAANHDQRVPDDHALIKAAHPKQRLRHAVEVRHESFRNRDFYELLGGTRSHWWLPTTQASGRSLPRSPLI